MLQWLHAVKPREVLYFSLGNSVNARSEGGAFIERRRHMVASLVLLVMLITALTTLLCSLDS